MSRQILALDIGGANLKACDSLGRCLHQPFELWKQPGSLASQLMALDEQLPGSTHWAITMTAELCDCFETKQQGVAHVLEAVQQAAGQRAAKVWGMRQGWLSLEQANAQPLDVAAGNWHALATFQASTHRSLTALMIDTGSTTTDIVLLEQGRPSVQGWNDCDRLATGELVYIGLGRTPVCSLGPSVIWQDREQPLMAEHFASTADIFRLTGLLPEQTLSTDTADGRPATLAASAARLARCVGADMDMLSFAQVQQLAQALSQQVITRISQAIARVAGFRRIERVLLSGSGERLASVAAQEALPSVSQELLSDSVGTDASAAACAFAMVQLLEGSCK